ncbi:unnamed protein product [Orchesella dallaii]|uniref:Uncharacterized protein n=1 Tax=Orchesella dallaii TaxID=48710 RepID=A0ABP1RHS9_9HEXA
MKIFMIPVIALEVAYSRPGVGVLSTSDEIGDGGQDGQTRILVMPQRISQTITPHPNVQQTPETQPQSVTYFPNNGTSSSSGFTSNH